MDNDNKIKPLVTQGSSVFLREDPSQLVSKEKLYSLDEEFAKTRKNRSYTFYLLFISFLALIIGGTIFLTAYIQNLNERMDIKITDFEDLNLKDLLDASKKDYGDMIQAKQDVMSLKQGHERRISS